MNFCVTGVVLNKSVVRIRIVIFLFRQMRSAPTRGVTIVSVCSARPAVYIRDSYVSV